jgi:uncharacterized protein (TIGR02246 family)
MGALAALILGVFLAMQTGLRSDESAAIVALEERLARAWVERDRAFIDGLLAPDWTVTDPSGRVLTKQQVLDETFSSTERRVESMTIDEVAVRFVGEIAIATGRTRASGSYRGQVASVVLRFTDVLARRDGRWQVVVSHGTMVAP